MLKGLRTEGGRGTKEKGRGRSRPLNCKKPRRMFKGGRRDMDEPLRASLTKLPKAQVGVVVSGDTSTFRYERVGSGKMIGPDPGGEYRYPLHDGGALIIRPEGESWVCIHPARGVVGGAPSRDIALAMAEAYAESMRPN